MADLARLPEGTQIAPSGARLRRSAGPDKAKEARDVVQGALGAESERLEACQPGLVVACRSVAVREHDCTEIAAGPAAISRRPEYQGLASRVLQPTLICLSALVHTTCLGVSRTSSARASLVHRSAMRNSTGKTSFHYREPGWR